MKAKPLYLASNLEELNKKTLMPQKVYSQAPKLQLNCVEKLLEEGRIKEVREKDEEQAYIKYMKSWDIIQHAFKNPKLPKGDRDYFEKLHNMDSISEKCQKLSDSLKKRYHLYVRDMPITDLMTLIEAKTLEILIIDCRSASDYTDAHIDHPNCISVPSELLMQGYSAKKIGESLRAQCQASYVDWSKRERFEKIILYDWNSSFEHQGPALQVVYDAITK
ncbi:unnamed protein product, partial [Allacma fusca]